MFENRVPPDRLFDPDVAGPPADAFDVQFRVPLSLAVYVDQLLTEDRQNELADVQRFYETLVDNLVPIVQGFCGWIEGDAGRVAARLAITTVVEPTVAGVAGLRPHAHVYIGGTATNLVDGRTAPVTERRVRQGVFGGVWPDYSGPLKGELSEHHGLTWARAHGGVHEIVDPPLADQMPGMEQVVCRGPWGPRRLVLADESYLAGCAESEALVAHQRAIGMPGA